MKSALKRVSLMLTIVMVFSLLSPLGAVFAADGGVKTITVLGTSDLHGRIYAWDYATDSADTDAGFAKVQTVVKQLKAENPNTILIDNGDTVQDNMADLFNNNPVHPMVEALNYMGYETWTLGNHEFNFGLDFLNKNIAAFNGKTLAANIYKEDGTRYVNPYKIIEKDGVRIAIVGIITPHIPKWEASNPNNFKGLTFTDPVEEAKKVVKELEGKYDVLIGSMHMGDTAEYGTTDGVLAVAEACPEFDAILAGHKHAKFDNIVSKSGVKLIEPGNYGWAVAKIDVNVVKENGAWTVKDVTTKNVETVKAVEDEEMKAKFAYVHKTSQEEANKVVGRVTDNFLVHVDYITGQEKVTTMPTAQIEDTSVMDFINEVQQFYAGADVSSAALFKADSNLKAGPFKKKDVAFIYMYENTLMGVNITGKNLKAYMEWSASYYNQYKAGDLTVSFNPDIRGYNYDMFSGVDYQIDISKPAGSRIVNPTINSQPIQDDKVYKLALNNYRFGTLLGLKLVTEADKYFDSYAKYGDAGRVRDLIGKYVAEQKGGVITPIADNNWKLTGYDFSHPAKDEVYAKIRSGEIKIPTSFDGRTLNVKSVNVDDLAKMGTFKDTKVISLVSVNDFHGALAGDSKNPGIAKLAGYLKNEKTVANPKGTILLSAGDMFQGSADSNLLYGRPVLAAMNEIGFEAMAIGNHEFDWGIDKLNQLRKGAQFPFLAANIVEKATGKNPDFAKPYTIIERDGVKVGIIGIATPETLTKTKPEMVAPYDFKNPAETVNALVPELKKQGADLIVVLSHLGAMQDSKTKEITGEAADLAKAVTGVDAIISGHTHRTVAGTVNNIPIVQGYYSGREAGHIDLFLDANTKAIKKANVYSDKEVIKAVEDAKVKTWFEFVTKAIAPIKSVVIGKASDTFSHNKETQVTLLGNWASDVMRELTSSDIAFQNGGGLRRDIPAGDITMGLMYELMPFDNTLFTVEMTGKQVRETIEHGIMPETMSPGQFSGVIVKYDSTKAKGERIVEVRLLDGTLLDDNKTYKVVTNDFQAGGGDGYVWFKQGKNGLDTGIPVRDALVDYIKAKGTITPVNDGRLTDINAAQTSMLYFDLAA